MPSRKHCQIGHDQGPSNEGLDKVKVFSVISRVSVDRNDPIKSKNAGKQGAPVISLVHELTAVLAWSLGTMQPPLFDHAKFVYNRKLIIILCLFLP